jgi:hypothetical protein
MNAYLHERKKSFLHLSWAGVICSIGCAIVSATATPEATDPDKLYSAVKATVQDLFRKEHMFKESHWFGHPLPPDRDLFLCHDAETELGVPWDAATYLATTTALQLEVYKAELDKLKIPRSVAEKSFAAIEKFGAATLNDPAPAGVEDALRKKREAEFYRLKEQLAQELNAYAKNRRGLPHFVVIGGCGAGEVEVAINTAPPGGTVTYIPLFRYKLCEATHVDPNDSQNCDGWVTAVSIKESMLGKYMFTATWPDGRKKSGTLNITKDKNAVNIAP